MASYGTPITYRTKNYELQWHGLIQKTIVNKSIYNSYFLLIHLKTAFVKNSLYHEPKSEKCSYRQMSSLLPIYKQCNNALPVVSLTLSSLCIAGTCSPINASRGGGCWQGWTQFKRQPKAWYSSLLLFHAESKTDVH
jgi:hypothetical protein